MHTYTYDKLAKNTVIFTKGTPNPTKKYEVELILPYVGTKSVLVKLKAWGTTQHNIHNVTLLFSDCEILEGEQKVSLWEYFKIDYQGKVYYIKKFNKFRNPLTWRCTCQSAFYSFAFPAYRYGKCLYGPPPRMYIRKTKTRPPRNPRNIIAVCKHTFHAWQFLKQKGLTIN